jgi:hypothetical protein
MVCFKYRLRIMVGDGFRWLEMVEMVDGWLMLVGDVLK